jgi:hypothetical protein
MRRFFFAALVLIALGIGVSVVAGSGAAAPVPDNSTLSNQSVPDSDRIDLSRNVDIVDWTYAGGEFRVTFITTLPTSIVVTDSMSVVEQLERSGGSSASEIPRRSYTLEVGRSTISFPATQVRDQSAITIGAEGELYLLRTGSIGDGGLTSGPYPMGTLQLAVLSGAVSVALVIIYKTYRYSQAEDVEPERVA